VHLVVEKQGMQKQNKLLNAGPQFLSKPTYIFFFRVNPASLPGTQDSTGTVRFDKGEPTRPYRAQLGYINISTSFI